MLAVYVAMLAVLPLSSDAQKIQGVSHVLATVCKWRVERTVVHSFGVIWLPIVWLTFIVRLTQVLPGIKRLTKALW